MTDQVVNPTSGSVTIGGNHTLNLPKLDGANYQSWIEMLNLALEVRGWKSAITEEAPNTIINAQAKFMLLEAMNESHRAQVRGCATAKAILERLQLIYADRSAANLYRLLHQYYRYSKKPEDTMSEHVGKMDEMRNQLADLGEKQSDAVYQITLIGSLPSEYASIMEIWELTHKEMRTTENLVSRLLKREEDIKNNSSQALLASGSRVNRRNIPSEEKLKKITCYNCQQKGHYAKDCPNPMKPRFTGNKTGEERPETADSSLVARTEVNFSVTKGDIQLKEQWICDSGASSHMCNQVDWFSTLDTGEKGRCYVGDGQSLEVLGTGSVSVKAAVGKEQLNIELHNVLLVPKLATNLISVGAAGEAGITTSFSKDNCVMKIGEKDVAVGQRLKDRLYIMNLTALKQNREVALTSRAQTSLNKYHRVLGHVSEDRIRRLLKSLGIEAKPGDTISCADCPGGKGKHTSHPSVDRITDTPGVIHADLSGIVNKEALQGYKYYLLCKDEFSEFTCSYFCKEKNEVPRLIAQFLIDFETVSGCKVKEFHSDNGSEFVNKVTRILFLKERVKHHTSAPFCPQQNGRIEREMQSITNMARVMLNAARLPKTLWAQAIESAVHIKNRLPTKRDSRSPVERLTGTKPSIDHLVEFGTPVHVLINDQYLTKWDCRTSEGYVVGFTRRHNTYSVYLPNKEKIIQTCDVIFAEHSEKSTTTETKRNVGEIVSNDGPITEARNVEGNETNKTSEIQQKDSNAGKNMTSTPKENVPIKSTISREELERFFKKFLEGSESDDSIYENIPRKRVEPSCPPYDQCNDEYCASIEKQERYSDDITIPEYSVIEPRTPRNNQPDKSFLSMTNNMPDQPKTYQEAMASDDREHWKQAIEAELNAHTTNGTWSIVKRPKGASVLSVKWIFTVKRDSSGNRERFKARLVARGFEQRPGVDYFQTFAPVARLDSIRTLLSISASQKMVVAQFDISTAFLNGKLEEDVYINPPVGVMISEQECLKLDKALYGLKQAPRAWNSTFNTVMQQLDMIPTLSDTCVYASRDKSMFLVLYVDDGMIFARNKPTCDQLLNNLEKHFKLKRLEGDLFLGINITRSDDATSLNQTRYIRDVVKRFNLQDACPVSSPIIDPKSLTTVDSPQTRAPYREAIGCLQYLACATRPDILFAVSFLAQFNQNPREIQWTAVKRVIRYLKGTEDYSITYQSGPLEIMTYSDADWANDETNRRSTSGLLIILGGGPVVFASRKQSAIAQSSTEAEYIAANETTKELKWLVQFLKELGVVNIKSTLHIDNLSTIRQIENNETRRRSKHIELRYHYIRQEYQAGLFNIQPVISEEQLADTLTKATSGPQIERMATRLKLKKKNKDSKAQCSIAIFALLMTSVATIASANNLQQGVRLGSPYIFLKTSHVVAEGVNSLNLDVNFPNICGQEHELVQDAEYDINRQSSRILTDLCWEAFNELGETIKKLGTCMPETGWSKLVRRVKRFFEPITILITLSIVAVVLGTSTLVSYLDPESDHNKLKGAIAENDQQRAELNAVKQEFQSTQKVTDNQNKILRTIADRSLTNEKALKQSAAIHTTIAWRSTTMGIRLYELNEGLLAMRRACTDRQIGVQGLNRIVKLDELDNAKDEDTTLKSIELRSNNSIRLTAWINVIDDDSSVVEVIGLPHIANYTTKPVWANYHGPNYLIYNASNNCLRAIEKPIGRVTYERCDTDHFRDPRLDDFRPSGVSLQEIKKTFQPIIHEVADDNLVHCTYHNVTIGDHTSPCSALPLLIPRDMSFSIGDIKYTAKTKHIVKTTTRAFIEDVRPVDISSAEFLENSKLFQALEASQVETGQIFNFKGGSLTITPPGNWSSLSFTNILSWLVSGLGGVASIITIMIFVLACNKSGSGRLETREQETHNESITIINEPVNQETPTIAKGDNNYELVIQALVAQHDKLRKMASELPPPLPPKPIKENSRVSESKEGVGE